ncbi:MAG TPA: M56 family metallopeptidase, partial [Allosphingosinicella sp.]|nr:M56 family metallopeptidase [Allosphingosinicella sp.]
MSFGFLIEMGWKSALIAGVALATAAILRSRAAADRAAILRVAVTLLLLLPLFSLGLPKLEIEAWAPEAVAIPADLASTAIAQSTGAIPEMTAPTIWDDPSLLFLILYLGGVAMAAARLGAGLWTLRRWTKGAREVDCPRWTEAFERARWAAQGPANLRLLVSDEAASPLSWGLLRPAILIDRDTLDEPEDADAILAHEIAHVVRRDWAVLMLTRTAAALFWFNPLVWLLEREVVQQAEEAADIEAALWVEPARYAQTLVHWAQFNTGSLVPANSIAPSATALARRVRAILDARRRATPSGSPVTFAAIAASALFAVTVAVLQLIPAVAQAHDAPAAPPAPAAVAAAPAPAPVAHPAAMPVAPGAPRVATGAAPAAVPAVAALAAAHDPEAPVAPPTPPAPPAWPTPPEISVDVRVPRIDVRVPRINVRVPRVDVRVPRIEVDVAQAVAIATAQAASARDAAASVRVEVGELVAVRVHGVSAADARA